MPKRRRLFHLGLWGPPVDEGVDWEIEHHIQERVDELMSSGLPKEQAEAEARRDFGDIKRIRHELRAIDRATDRRLRFGELLETVLHDVAYGIRGLIRNPIFALSLLLTLGLGIGANVAMFSVLDALLLRPLPYRSAQELHTLMVARNPDDHGMPYLSWEFAREWRARQQVFERMIIHARGSLLYAGGAEPLTLSVQAVTPEFEETLGVQPVLGRGFVAEDALAGAVPVALLNHGFWTAALGSDSSRIGQTIEFDGERVTVIGVMPKVFKFPEYSTTELWVPLQDDGLWLGKPASTVNILGRIRAGNVAAAEARAQPLGETLFTETRRGGSTPPGNIIMRLRPFDSMRASNPEVKRSITLLGGAVLFILLVAGANMINLLLVRGVARTHELAVRMALGASRRRLIRQLATETLTVALASSVISVVFAFVALRSITGIMPDSITFFAPYAIQIERRALLFAFAITLICGIGFGVLPALLATRRSRRSADLSRYASSTPARSRLRRGLVVLEVALSVTLLVGAGLLIQSFVSLNRVDPGFEPDNLAVLSFQVSRTAHPEAGERGEYLRRLEERIEAVPGVSAATRAVGLPPHSGFSFGVNLEAEGELPRTQGNPEFLPHANVRPDFFEVMGALLIAGRAFIEADTQTDNVIIDQDLARFLWPSGSPIGRRFRYEKDGTWLTVIGVMKDLKLMGPDDRRGDFELLFPAGRSMGGQISIAIRTQRDPRPVLGAIRAAVHEIDSRQPILSLAPATVVYAEAIEMPRFLLILVSVLAALALILAAIGIYGLLTFAVSQRAHELGVRIALGARAQDLVAMVIREGFALAVIGALIGIASAIALTRFIRGTLFGVQPLDPPTFAAVLATILVTALIASAYPARRAARVDPVTTLRAE